MDDKLRLEYINQIVTKLNKVTEDVFNNIKNKEVLKPDILSNVLANFYANTYVGVLSHFLKEDKQSYFGCFEKINKHSLEVIDNIFDELFKENANE